MDKRTMNESDNESSTPPKVSRTYTKNLETDTRRLAVYPRKTSIQSIPGILRPLTRVKSNRKTNSKANEEDFENLADSDSEDSSEFETERENRRGAVHQGMFTNINSSSDNLKARVYLPRWKKNNFDENSENSFLNDLEVGILQSGMSNTVERATLQDDAYLGSRKTIKKGVTPNTERVPFSEEQNQTERKKSLTQKKSKIKRKFRNRLRSRLRSCPNFEDEWEIKHDLDKLRAKEKKLASSAIVRPTRYGKLNKSTEIFDEMNDL